jgi:hypothetical protein
MCQVVCMCVCVCVCVRACVRACVDEHALACTYLMFVLRQPDTAERVCVEYGQYKARLHRCCFTLYSFLVIALLCFDYAAS